MSDNQTWRDALQDIGNAKPLDEETEEQLEESAETPGGEESPAEDKVTEVPQDDEEESSEQVEGEKPAETEEEPEESETETEATAEEEVKEDEVDDGKFVMINGERVPLETVLEWRDQGLMRQDYSKKTSETAQMRKQLEAERRELQTLSSDIARDPALQRFLAANPEALQYLMADPKATRGLIGNTEAVKQFWSEYKVIKENPAIAERLYNRETPDEKPPEMVEAEMVQAAQAVGNSLNYAVEEVAKEFPGVDPVVVADYLFELGGLTKDNLPRDPALQRKAVFSALGRLQNMMFVSDGQQVFVDPRLIRDKFASLAAQETKKANHENNKAEAHNEKVDKALRAQSGPPATGKGGTPLAQGEKPKEYSSLQEALADIAR